MRKLMAMLLVLLMVLSMSACGSDDIEETTEGTTVSVPTTEAFDLDAYKEMVDNCVKEMYDGAVILYNMTNYESAYWKSLESIGGTVTAEKIFQYAIKWIEENSNATAMSIKAQYDDIAMMYKEIVSTEVVGAEAEEIEEVFKTYYDAYIGLFNLAHSPAGNRDSFAEKCGEYVETIKTSESKLNTLLS